MKTIFAICFIGFVYVSPVIAVLTVITALFITSILAQLLTDKAANDAVLDQHYQDIKDLFQAVDDIIAKPVYQDDIWQVTAPTSCELACPVSFPAQPVLALPSSNVVLVDYTELSYKELQAKCRQLRTKKNNIKLNSKRDVLIQYLIAHA